MGLRIKISGCQSLPSRGRLPPVDLTPSRYSPLPRGKLRYELLVSVKSPPPLMTLSDKFFFPQTKITKFARFELELTQLRGLLVSYAGKNSDSPVPLYNSFNIRPNGNRNRKN